MLKISIIPDTNVLLLNLELVKGLYSSKLPILYSINFSRTVLEELDKMKAKKVEARNAIRFIESISSSLKTEIEGKIDDRKVDVVIETRETIQPKNNDDKILNYCFQLENPIFLTNDKAFCLKCQSFNIKSIKVENMGIEDLISSIMKKLGIEDARILKECRHGYIDRLKRIVEATIQPTIIEILYKELGDGFDLVVQQNPTLEHYLEIIKTNFIIFRRYFPTRTPKIIDEFLVALRNEDMEKAKDLAHPICMLFRKSFPRDAL
ncbi:uncharacterized protein VICG_00455 [Vittaforma corneae ATCC 50505]|uniref:PIN domain-containing protein n=1 Tax=Vittaforma corneae (strain ATCC 50505) TaxID=993615 RepID=L2GPV6_VITCO|nr:uncharacterized protein VICG_00455 [Vittaforma corneae ATCC 50505]ELA42357.1 hypothetical protein VICG_00455 [Vittaforma corneae ATCC 50505]